MLILVSVSSKWFKFEYTTQKFHSSKKDVVKVIFDVAASKAYKKTDLLLKNKQTQINKPKRELKALNTFLQTRRYKMGTLVINGLRAGMLSLFSNLILKTSHYFHMKALMREFQNGLIYLSIISWGSRYLDLKFEKETLF